MMKFINYLRPAWEGEDGKPSYRRIAQFVHMVIAMFLVATKATNTQYGYLTFIANGVIFLLLVAVITAQQVIECIHGISKLKQFTKDDIGGTE